MDRDSFGDDRGAGIAIGIEKANVELHLRMPAPVGVDAVDVRHGRLDLEPSLSRREDALGRWPAVGEGARSELDDGENQPAEYEEKTDHEAHPASSATRGIH